MARTAQPSASHCDRQNHRPCRKHAAPRNALEISDFFIGGAFFANDLILRAKGHPECVTHIQPAAEPLADAGTLVVGSDLVGTAGGPPAPFVIDPDPFNHDYFAFPDQPLFNFPDSIKVQLRLAGAAGFPPIRSQTLRSPGFATITVTAPQIPDTGVLAASSTVALKLGIQRDRNGDVVLRRVHDHGQRHDAPAQHVCQLRVSNARCTRGERAVRRLHRILEFTIKEIVAPTLAGCSSGRSLTVGSVGRSVSWWHP